LLHLDNLLLESTQQVSDMVELLMEAALGYLETLIHKFQIVHLLSVME